MCYSQKYTFSQNKKELDILVRYLSTKKKILKVKFNVQFLMYEVINKNELSISYHPFITFVKMFFFQYELLTSNN